jgi:Domain of unknown function (DUF1996)
MRRYAIFAVTTVLGVGAVVAAGAAASAFGSKGSSRSFARVAHQVKPNGEVRPVKSLARLRGVNFVSGCRFSHRNTDDPIVFPGQPGKSHDHTFIGNDTTNAFSTLSSLLGQSSSCRRPGDTAAYWAPTLIDAGGQAVTPRSATVYYRRHTLDPVQPFPQGFKLIAGNSKATEPQALMVTYWNCGPVAGIRPTSTIPMCPDAQRQALTLHVRFPNCWDGVNLDSPDHQSHMAYSVRGRCPSDHPVAMPAIQVNLRYPTAGGPGFALSSGGQFSGHADFFNAWQQGVLTTLVQRCLNGLRHCQQGS